MILFKASSSTCSFSAFTKIVVLLESVIKTPSAWILLSRLSAVDISILSTFSVFDISILLLVSSLLLSNSSTFSSLTSFFISSFIWKNLTSFLRSCYSRRIQEALCMPFKYLRVNHDSLLLGAGCDVCYFWKKCSCYRRLWRWDHFVQWGFLSSQICCARELCQFCLPSIR